MLFYGERQQGKERYCPYNGMNDDQGNGSTVQLQTKYSENALGRERQQG